MKSLADVKKQQQRTWASSDYSVMATSIYPTAEVLCDDVAVAGGSQVLDVACGSGNVAIAAARRQASVTGIDFVPTLLERARQRAVAEGLSITFLEADAEALPFADASFDVVLSAFGVMFAPDQGRAAAELLRVCRPGGLIGLANWTPTSAAADIFRLGVQFTSAPPVTPPPVAWGTVNGLQRLFGDRVSRLRLHDRIWLSRFVSVEQFLDTYRTYFGPVKQVFAKLDGERLTEYESGLIDIAHRFNRATDGTLAMAFSYVTVVIDC